MMILILLFAPFILTIAAGQDGVPLAEMYLKGRWKAECPIEVKHHAGMYVCELCSFIIDKNDRHIATFADFEMDFGEDSLTIIQNEKSVTVPYTTNKDTHAFSFLLNEKQYSFRVFHHDDIKIIEDSEGLLLVLTMAE